MVRCLKSAKLKSGCFAHVKLWLGAPELISGARRIERREKEKEVLSVWGIKKEKHQIQTSSAGSVNNRGV